MSIFGRENNGLGNYGYGSWRSLPEFGITEMFGGKTGSLDRANLYNNQPKTFSEPAVLGDSIGPVQGPEYDPSLLFSGTGQSSGGAGGGSLQSASGSNFNNIFSNDIQSTINNQFESEMSFLDDTEKSIRGQANSAIDSLNKDYATARGQVEDQRGLRRDEITRRRTEAKQDESRANVKIKQNLNNLRQSINAQLSAMGGGVSSTGEAMGERYGNIAATQTGDLRTATTKVLGEIQNESDRIENFYDTQLSNLQTNLSKAIQGINSELNSRISAVDSARFQSRQAKSERTFQARADAENKLMALISQSNGVKAALDAWMGGKVQTLTNAAQMQIQNTSRANVDSYGNATMGTTQALPQQEMTYLPRNVRIGKQQNQEDLVLPNILGMA